MERKGIIDVSMKEEKELLKLAQEGNREALNRLLISYMPFIEKRAIEYVSYGMEKDDLMQDGLIWLYDLIKSYSYENKLEFRYYVNREIEKFFQKMIANNNMTTRKDFIDKINNNEEFGLKIMSLDDAILEIDKEELAHGEMDPVFDEVLREAKLSYIKHCIDVLVKRGELNERQVKIIELYVFKEMSINEIGKLMGCSQQAICNNYNRIVAKLVDAANGRSERQVESVYEDEPPFDWNNVWKLLEQISIKNDVMDMLRLYFEDGLSYDEVALKCGVSGYHINATFDRLWERLGYSWIKPYLMEMFSESKDVRRGFKRRRMLENRRRKRIVK